MASQTTTQDGPAKKPDYDEFPKVIGYHHNSQQETMISVPSGGDIELDPEYRVRFSHICSNNLLGGFADHEGSQVIVVNGNDIRKDKDGLLLSLLCGHMIRTFQKTVKGCVILNWACTSEDTHPHRMVVGLLGQLLSKAEIALPIPTEGWETMKYYDLLSILRECIEVQLARTPVLVVVDSVQHYEFGEEPKLVRDALQTLSILAEIFQGVPGRVTFKMLVASLGDCRYQTEPSNVVKILNMADIPGASELWEIKEEK